MFVLDQTKNDRHLKFGAHSPMSISKNAIFQNSRKQRVFILFGFIYAYLTCNLTCNAGPLGTQKSYYVHRVGH